MGLRICWVLDWGYFWTQAMVSVSAFSLSSCSVCHIVHITCSLIQLVQMSFLILSL